MKNRTASIGLAACAGFAMAAVAAISTASAQTTLYPAGTDCSRLVGTSQTECTNQMRNSASPDTSNNTSNNQLNSEASNYRSGMGMGVDPNNHENYRNYPGAGADCAEMVGNTKGDCAARATHGPSHDDSNNTDMMN
ncbi:hypothetical protein [Dongia sedimenti]|uniref:Uncharacterized protein n=1 Tax=Dongia sedimenti TaxID=3064282 RepID=A0ABU0YJ83_9PROT|nr:hypothetical protein [Rhodospirillaceae bacterium R-7]